MTLSAYVGSRQLAALSGLSGGLDERSRCSRGTRSVLRAIDTLTSGYLGYKVDAWTLCLDLRGAAKLLVHSRPAFKLIDES